MTIPKERLQKAMEGLASELEAQVPETKPIFDRVRTGKLTPDEGMSLLSELMIRSASEDTEGTSSDLLERIQIVLDQKAALPGQIDEDVENSLSKVSEPSQNALEKMGMTVDSLFYEDEVDGKVKLNPMYQTAILERLQFDGDAPELRMGGDLPRDQKAAVPVEHDGDSPVALGYKLHHASEEVTQRIEELRKEREKSLDLALLEAAQAILKDDQDSKALAVSTAKKALAELLRPLDVEGYRRGQVAEAKRVEGPTVGALVAMSASEKRQFAYKAISTTQGRRSSVPTIGTRVVDILSQEGFTSLEVKPSWSKKTALAQAYWTMTLNVGQDDISPNFSPIRLASTSLGRRLSKTLKATQVAKDTDLLLEIDAVNDLGKRKVGWKAQIVLAHERMQLEEGKDGKLLG